MSVLRKALLSTLRPICINKGGQLLYCELQKVLPPIWCGGGVPRNMELFFLAFNLELTLKYTECQLFCSQILSVKITSVEF